MVITNTTVNCVVVGGGMVGKTCLAQKFSGHEISKDYVATIMDSFSGNVSAYGEQYKVNIKDTAGQFEDVNVRNCVYKQSDVCVVCYSAVDRDSMESVKTFWIPEIQRLSKKIAIILVATQVDIRVADCQDHIKMEEGKQLAKDVDIEHFVETSSFNNAGVKQTFENAVKAVVINRKRKTKWLKSMFAS